MLMIQTNTNEIEKFQDLETQYPSDIRILKRRSVVEDITPITIIVTISLPIITAITKILIELIRKKQPLKLKYKDIVLEGVSEKTMLKVIQQIQKDSQLNKINGEDSIKE